MRLIYQIQFKKILLLTLVLLSVANLKAQQVITIKQAVDLAVKNNLQIKQAEFSERLNDINLEQSKLALYPNLNASVGQNLGWGRNQVASGLYQNTTNYSMNMGLSTGVELFGGLSKINQIRQNKSLLEAGKSNTEKIKNDLTLSVITAYLQVLFNKDLLKTAHAQQIVAQEQFNQQQKFLNAGTKTMADVSQAKSQLATAELSVTEAENALKISYLNLSQLMEMPSSSSFEVQAPLIDGLKNNNVSSQAEEVFQKALTFFPDIKMSESNTKAAEWAVKSAKGNLYPRLSFNASYGTSYYHSQNPFITNNSFEQQLKDNISKGIGLSLTIPIFNGLQAKAGVKRAQINLMQTQAQEQMTKNNLSKVIYQAVADARAAESKYSFSVKAFAAQKDAYFAIEQRYQVGLANSVEFNTALTNSNKAENDLLQSKYDFLFKTKVIDFYLGNQIIF